MIQRNPILDFISHAILILGVIVVFFPIYVTFVGSTQTAAQILSSNPISLIPGSNFLESYRFALFGGKTEAGAVWLSPERTSPYAFYQFWLNTDDNDVIRYLKLFTFLPQDEIAELEAAHGRDAGARTAHRALARHMTELLHGSAELKLAEAEARLAAFPESGPPTNETLRNASCDPVTAFVAGPTKRTPTNSWKNAAPCSYIESVPVIVAAPSCSATTTRGRRRRPCPRRQRALRAQALALTHCDDEQRGHRRNDRAKAAVRKDATDRLFTKPDA